MTREGTAISRTAPDDASSARFSLLPPGRTRRAIVWGGLLCGILDISAAFVLSWALARVGPIRVLQGIAEALLGPSSASGGLGAAALGLAMHFGVAFFWAAVFALLCRRFPALLRWSVPAGLIYGAVVWIVMYRVVIPLIPLVNALYLTTFDRTIPQLRVRQVLVHFVCVGLPISLAARRAGRSRPEHELGAR
jgi:glucan phosphoethanolaminetransferase (alkaline phosphatase superfamily)